MQFNFSITLVSSNRKTGPIPVVRTSRNSCPNTCELKGNGCYAEVGHTSIWWRKLDKQGKSLDEILEVIRQFPKNTIYRWNEAGDLPHSRGKIDHAFVLKITAANEKKKGFTYTHHSMNSLHNQIAVKTLNECGFTTNLSSNNVNQADEFVALNVAPVVTIVSPDVWSSGKNYFRSPKGNVVIRCPNEYIEQMTCKNCQICAVSNRKAIVAFSAHGVNKRKVIKIAKEN